MYHNSEKGHYISREKITVIVRTGGGLSNQNLDPEDDPVSTMWTCDEIMATGRRGG
jgi:hypothetical protein